MRRLLYGFVGLLLAGAAAWGFTVSSNQNGFSRIAIQTFIAAGTPTYTPAAGMVYDIVECRGAGGAGGASVGSATAVRGGGGGGQGAYSRVVLTAAQIGASQTVTVGAAGTGTATTGNVGNDTSFGALCLAKGGGGGTQSDGASLGGPGVGGPAGSGTGDYKLDGSPGRYGVAATITTVINGSGGGGGDGGGQPRASNGIGQNGTTCGAGGSGGWENANAVTVNGGDGFAGCVVVTEFIH